MRKKEAGQKIDLEKQKNQFASQNVRSPKKIEPYSSPKKGKNTQLKTEGSEDIVSISEKE